MKKALPFILSASLFFPANAHQHPPKGRDDFYPLYSAQCQEARKWVSAVRKTLKEIEEELKEDPDTLQRALKDQQDFLRSRTETMKEYCF